MTPSSKDRAALISAATSAHRQRDLDGQVSIDPAWLDLDAAGRAEAFEVTVRLRAVEAALDPAGLSTTAHAVLSRLRR